MNELLPSYNYILNNILSNIYIWISPSSDSWGYSCVNRYGGYGLCSFFFLASGCGLCSVAWTWAWTVRGIQKASHRLENGGISKEVSYIAKKRSFLLLIHSLCCFDSYPIPSFPIFCLQIHCLFFGYPCKCPSNLSWQIWIRTRGDLYYNPLHARVAQSELKNLTEFNLIKSKKSVNFELIFIYIVRSFKIKWYN